MKRNWRKSERHCEGTQINERKRGLKALELRAMGKSSKEIGSVTGFHPAYITTLTAKYQAGGIEAISGNHRNMSWEKETELLEEYEKRSGANSRSV